MRDWIAIVLGVGCLVGLGLLAHGCGGGSTGGPVPLSPEDKAAVEAAAGQVAEAASKGDTSALDAAISTGLPERNLHAIRAALAALKRRAPLKVTRVEAAVSGSVTVTLEGAAGPHAWQFDRRPGGGWSLSGV